MTQVTITIDQEDLEIVVVALFRLAGSEHKRMSSTSPQAMPSLVGRTDRARHAGVIAKELAHHLNVIDPGGVENRPIGHGHIHYEQGVDT